MFGTTTIHGGLTKTPAVKTLDDGRRVTTLRVAVSDFRLAGEEKKRYVDVDQWGDAADRAADRLVQGQQVTAEGRLDANAYLDSDGQPQVGWKLAHATVEYGARPLREVPSERLADEALRRSQRTAGPQATAEATAGAR